MEVRPVDRLIMAMLCELSKAPEERELDFDLIEDAVWNGCENLISWKYGMLLNEQPYSEEQIQMTADILQMFKSLEYGYSLLSDADKDEIKAENHGEEPNYQGFDGNEEGEFLAISEFMISKLNRFEEFVERARLNSHHRNLSRYTKMSNAYKSIIQSRMVYNGLVKSEILAIVKAGRMH